MDPRDILIVNGSPGRRHERRALLEHAGYAVREMVSADDALATARRSPPMAIVFEAPDDAGVPVRFAQRLRRHPRTHAVPMLVLKGDSERAGSPDPIPAVSWLPEPCPPRSFLEEIAYLTRPAGKSGPPFGMASPRSA